MAPAGPTANPSDPPRYNPAGRLRRLVARVIDYFVSTAIVAIVFIVAIPLWRPSPTEPVDSEVAVQGLMSRISFTTLLTFVLASLLNDVLLVGLTGSSIGKLLTGTKIVTARNHRLGLGRAFLRASPAFLSLIPVFGLIISGIVGFANVYGVFVDPREKSGYDWLANTRVVLRYG